MSILVRRTKRTVKNTIFFYTKTIAKKSYFFILFRVQKSKGNTLRRSLISLVFPRKKLNLKNGTLNGNKGPLPCETGNLNIEYLNLYMPF